jgi:hypothetical protein
MAQFRSFDDPAQSLGFACAPFVQNLMNRQFQAGFDSLFSPCHAHIVPHSCGWQSLKPIDALGSRRVSFLS